MIIIVSDSQTVSEVQSTLVTVLQQGSVDMPVIMKNSGVNTINYQWQEYTGSAWQVIGNAAQGSDYYNTLSPNQVLSLLVESSYPQVQLVGNASGGAMLEFTTTRYFNRASGGSIPILSL